MSSKKEEEKNEKIIRGLMKLPPNRKCINCNSLGPQYVCTNFWTFVCIACSGIHREFTHRVKSVSMAKFTKQEVEALQRGGNQRAREMFLKDWDMQRMRLPNSSNPDKIREFIKNVYVDKKYAGGRSSDKPPRDMQGSKNYEEEHRRASSYHSYSQSPPYEQQYEERRYGKQSGVLTRKPGSDRALYEGKISSFMFSPGRLREHMYEDRFANESTGSRISDYSVSSAGDPFKHDGHSPNFQDTGYSSPPQKVRDILVQDTRAHMLNPRAEANIRENFDGIPRPHRTTSSSSFGSFDSNSMSLKSVNSGSLVVVLDPEHPSKTQQAEASTFGTLLQSSTSHSSDHDLFNLPSMQLPRTTSAPSIDLFADVNYQPSSVTTFEQKPLDLFADINHQPSSMTPSEKNPSDLFADINHQPSSMTPSEQKPLDLFADNNHQPSFMTQSEQKPVAIAQPENEGWATFDLPQNVRHASGMNEGTSSMLPSKDGGQKENKDVLSSIHNGSQWFPFPSSAAVGPFPPTADAADQWNIGVHKVQVSSDPNNSKSWNAFDDFSAGNIPQSLFGSVPFSSELQGSGLKPSTSGDNVVLKLPEGSVMDEFLNSAVDNGVTGFKGPSSGASGPQFPPPVPPVMEGTVQDRKSTNPFDVPFDSDMNANNAFLDVTSLQSALPNPQLPSPFLGGLPQPWFPQSSVNSYIPPVPHGGLSYVAGQTPNPQLPNVPPQGPVASLGGNPFA